LKPSHIIILCAGHLVKAPIGEFNSYSTACQRQEAIYAAVNYISERE
jgi:hypothetical protein